MNIGIDARVLGTSRALDRYTRNLIIQLSALKTKHTFIVFFSENLAFESLGVPKRNNLRYIAMPPTPVIWDHFSFGKRVRKQQLDVLFHPDNKSFLFCNVPQVTTLHDLTPQKFPGLVLSQDSFTYLRQRAYFFLQSEALKRNAKIITVSKNTKKDALSLLSLASDKVIPIYEGVESHFKPVSIRKANTAVKKYSLKKPYIFYMGGFGRHKNVLNLVKAFAVLKNSFKDINLVLGGKKDDAGSSGQNTYPELAALVKKKHLSKQVLFAGYIDEEDLPLLYSGAKVFVYPSKYEGFGFPPLEAMACGTPVVCSKAASLPEVGGKAVLYGQSVDELIASIGKVLSNPALQRELSLRGLKQAKKFSWRRCARETLKIIERSR